MHILFVFDVTLYDENECVHQVVLEEYAIVNNHNVHIYLYRGLSFNIVSKLRPHGNKYVKCSAHHRR